MEEEVGFEPTERVNVRQFSRLLQSTALALLQGVWITLFYSLIFFCQYHYVKFARTKIRYPFSSLYFTNCFNFLPILIKYFRYVSSVSCAQPGSIK